MFPSHDPRDEYTVSPAWTFSTSPTHAQNYSISTNSAQSEGMAWRKDGTHFYIADKFNDDVNEYSVTTPWTVTGGAFVQAFDISGQETNPTGVHVKDGLLDNKLYVTGIINDKVYEYDVPCAATECTDDQQFNYVSTLLHMDGVDDAQSCPRS